MVVYASAARLYSAGVCSRTGRSSRRVVALVRVEELGVSSVNRFFGARREVREHRMGVIHRARRRHRVAHDTDEAIAELAVRQVGSEVAGGAESRHPPRRVAVHIEVLLIVLDEVLNRPEARPSVGNRRPSIAALSPPASRERAPPRHLVGVRRRKLRARVVRDNPHEPRLMRIVTDYARELYVAGHRQDAWEVLAPGGRRECD